MPTATGRPDDSLPLVSRLAFGLFSLFFALELALQILADGTAAPLERVLRTVLPPLLHVYLPVRQWALAHPRSALALGAVLFLALLLVLRVLLVVWHNQVVARLMGVHMSPDAQTFEPHSYPLLPEVARRPPGHVFVGMTPERSLLKRLRGFKWNPVYLTDADRARHSHVLGRSGSGKTRSHLLPFVLQDVLDGRGLVFIGPKGDDSEVRLMKGLAALAGREKDLRIFALPAWSQPEIESHTYNMVYVRPPTKDDRGGDVDAMAERVFSVLPLSDHEYYRQQAEILFTNVCRLLHGMMDSDGRGLPFTMRDILTCLKGVGDQGGWRSALDHCLRTSVNKDAARNIVNQVGRLDKPAETFTGLVSACERFSSDIVNAYDPDIIIEDVMQSGGIVYVQVPVNLYKIQAPALGRVLLQDIQQEGSLRQVFRQQRDQRPFSVFVDEFHAFADEWIITSLNMLRDANVRYCLAHQSPADLEKVGKPFAMAVWDNTYLRVILNQDNPDLCERISTGIGTQQQVSLTVRRQQGALYTSLVTGDASSRQVETFALHPNAIKSLASRGQAYVLRGQTILPVNMAEIPNLTADFPLVCKPQQEARGLRLYETFVAKRPPGAGQAQVGTATP